MAFVLLARRFQVFCVFDGTDGSTGKRESPFYVRGPLNYSCYIGWVPASALYPQISGLTGYPKALTGISSHMSLTSLLFFLTGTPSRGRNQHSFAFQIPSGNKDVYKYLYLSIALLHHPLAGITCRCVSVQC